jgi:hypothetical protein
MDIDMDIVWILIWILYGYCMDIDMDIDMDIVWILYGYCIFPRQVRAAEVQVERMRAQGEVMAAMDVCANSDSLQVTMGSPSQRARLASLACRRPLR